MWKTIESAPRDGTQILAGWLGEKEQESWDFAVLAYFQDWHGEGMGAWVLEGDFEVRFAPDGVHETPPKEYGDPTHWMSIPRLTHSEVTEGEEVCYPE